jgi:alpha-L-fucosidase
MDSAVISKHGNLLLNIPIRADGTLDRTATGILEDFSQDSHHGEHANGTDREKAGPQQYVV